MPSGSPGNSYSKTDGFGPVEMNSFNHYSYGAIVSEWRVTGRQLAYRVRLPANSTAALRIPTADPGTVREGRTPLSRIPGVRYQGFADGVASYELPSGIYELTSSLG
ncbi:alpha-L-rhamnosidase C-terminal domain-containing protein [Streptomyces sp. NPDC005921]|uniref:alpha-L-rhamnosidase C-terminal domain-containing protein n=1 Tax=Streptomyces sp. NPDC005827 TaxID=3157070 RepID=UPI0033C7D2FB